MAEKPYDLAIVGSGMAGCILAARIAEKGVHPVTGEPLRIALLEKGPWIQGVPRPGYGASEHRHLFTNLGSEFAGRYSFRRGLPEGQRPRLALQPGEEVHLSRTGMAVGGSSLLYTAIIHVPYAIDHEVWVDETGTDWDHGTFASARDETMRMLNIHEKPEALLRRLDRLFRDTARSLGYQPHPATLARRNCLYCGFCDGINFCKYDARLGGFVPYLPIALQHGVEVLAGADVDRVLIEKSGGRPRVGGVAFTSRGEARTLAASRVILAAGNFGNPPILYRSGYGPRSLVGDHLLVENGNVGHHTDCRPSAGGLTGIFDEPVSDGRYCDGNVAGAFWVYHDTTPDRRYQRVEIIMRANELLSPDRIALDSEAPPFGRSHRDFMGGIADPTAPTAAQRRLLSRCHVDIRLIRPREVRGYVNEWGEHIYRANDPRILKPLAEGREVAYQMLRRMGARTVLGMDGPVRVRGLPTYVGSCQPGTSARDSVIDSHFDSHDVDGLSICCGSTVPRGATHGYGGTVAALAAFAAPRIVERHFKRG